MKKTKIKEPVRLRFKEIANGGSSIYLDIYVDGVRRYEFLKLYLNNEKTKEAKEQNKQTLQLANAIKAERIIEIQTGKYDVGVKKKGNLFFFDLFESVAKTKKGNGWKSTLKCVKQFEKNEKILISNIDKNWINRFRDFLLKKKNENKDKIITINTARSYLSKIRTFFNFAMKEGIIYTNPTIGIDGVKQAESERMYLTLEELRQLSKSTYDIKDCVKRKFLFSCLTGLRHCDVEKLKWKDIHKQGNYTRIIFVQKKTKGQEYLDINDQAVSLLGERKDDDCLVFEKLKIRQTNILLNRWIKAEGINKKITFHCARHTFAIMMLEIGTDIYTVSKLLGHRELSTTQIYAKILDKKKQEAISNIPQILE